MIGAIWRPPIAPFAQAGLALVASLSLASLWLLAPVPLLPIAAMLGVLGLALAIRHPFLTCLFFLVFTYFRVHEAYPVLYNLRLPLVFSVLSLLSLIWHMIISRSIRPFMPKEIMYLILFFGIVTIGVVFAVNKPIAFDAWTTFYWKVCVMTVALAWLARKPDIQLASGIFVAAGVAIGIVAIYNKQTGTDLVEFTRVTIGRDLNSFLGDPNDLALVLLFPLGFAISTMVYAPGMIRKLLGGSAVLVILDGIVATQSRGGLIGVVAVASVFAMRHVRSKAVVVAGCAVAAFVLYGAMNVSSRVSGGAAEPGMDQSSSERIDTWKAAIRMAASRPLTGVGLFNAADNYYFYTDNFQGKALVIHSTWFTALGETGVPGFAAFVAMVVASLRSALRSVRDTRGKPQARELHVTAVAVFAALVGFCVSGTFLNQAFNWPIYVLVAMTAALSRSVAAPIAECSFKPSWGFTGPYSAGVAGTLGRKLGAWRPVS